MIQPVAYRSIFFEPDWRHPRYLGWDDCWPDAALRVLTKRNGPIKRHLILSDLAADSNAKLFDAIKRRIRPNVEITVHDFSKSPDLATSLSYCKFHPLDRERMLNIYTIVIDLNDDEATLLAVATADTRREIRLAQKMNVQIDEEAHHDPAAVSSFSNAYQALAKERGLQPMDLGELQAQIANGHSRLFTASVSGERTNYLQTYEAGRIAMYFRGVSTNKASNGAGRMLQWRAICRLKRDGFRWYDLGGLPTLDRKNGIVRFKFGFGGAIVDLGQEFRRSGRIVRAVRNLREVFLRLESSVT